MRERQYKVGYNKMLSIVKGRINKILKPEYTESDGMVVIAELNDLLPMVEYGVIAWPFGEPLDDSVEPADPKTWSSIGSAVDGEGNRWEYYISKPVKTFTEEEVDAMFQKYFAKLAKDDIGMDKKIYDAVIRNQDTTLGDF